MNNNNNKSIITIIRVIIIVTIIIIITIIIVNKHVKEILFTILRTSMYKQKEYTVIKVTPCVLVFKSAKELI